jgi:hypothetical protein
MDREWFDKREIEMAMCKMRAQDRFPKEEGLTRLLI